jgi:hypothetical protein
MGSRQRIYLVLGVFAAGVSLYNYQSEQSRSQTISIVVNGAKPALPERKAASAMEAKKPQPDDKFEKQNFIDEVQNNLAQHNRCYTEDCSAEEVHPRTAYYDAGQKVKAELLRLRDYVRQKNITDRQITDIALEALENSDGHVQEVALDLLSTQPTAPESLEAILEKVIRGYDAELVRQALNELQRYIAERDQQRIRTVLAEEMLHGAPFVGQAIAKNIMMFLNRESVPFFEAVVEKIVPGSIIYDSLQSSIREYRRKHG